MVLLLLGIRRGSARTISPTECITLSRESLINNKFPSSATVALFSYFGRRLTSLISGKGIYSSYIDI